MPFFYNTSINESDYKKKTGNGVPTLKGEKKNHSAIKTTFDQQLLFSVNCPRNKNGYMSPTRGRETVALMATVVKPLTLRKNPRENVLQEVYRGRALNSK